MFTLAIKMLLGDRAKYLGLVFGITFATLLISQQVSIFIGIMSRTSGAIDGIPQIDLWVMDPRVRYIDEVEPMREVELMNVRSVSGVDWAVPFYKGLTTIRMPDGLTQQVQLLGVDDVSLVGASHDMVLGDVDAIRNPQTAIMDKNGYLFTWPKETLQLGKYIEINDHRLIIKGICEAQPTFLTFPIVYITYGLAKEILPAQRNKMSFILVKAAHGVDIPTLQSRIQQTTGLQVLTPKEFSWRSIRHYLQRTGIPINFGITITLGIIIGIAITAQTFYMFIVENMKQFAVMKAVGITQKQILKMVGIQAACVYFIGFGLGIGMTSLFFFLSRHIPAFKGFFLRWEVMLGVFLLIGMIILLSVLVTLKKIYKIDPATVFRGA